MANAKQAVGNVLDTVIGISNTLTTSVNTVGKTAQYASRFMDAVLEKQVITLSVDHEIFKQQYVESQADQLAKQREAIELWADSSPRRKALYEEALAQLKAVVVK